MIKVIYLNGSDSISVVDDYEYATRYELRDGLLHIWDHGNMIATYNSWMKVEIVQDNTPKPLVLG